MNSPEAEMAAAGAGLRVQRRKRWRGAASRRSRRGQSAQGTERVRDARAWERYDGRGRSPLLQLAPGRRISRTLVHLSRVQSPALIARGAIAGTPPRAIVSAAELSTLRPLRPSRPLASAFTNNPG